MARLASLMCLFLFALSTARGRRSLESYDGRQFGRVGVTSSAVASSTRGSTIAAARSQSSTFTAIRTAASHAIAKAIASVRRGGSVEAEAHTIASSTAEAVADAYAASYGHVIVDGDGYAMVNTQSQAEAFAEAVAVAYAEAFSAATNDRYHSVAQAIAETISQGVAYALAQTSISIDIEDDGKVMVANREHVTAVTRIVAAAFASALSQVTVHQPYSVHTISDSNAVADSFVEHLSHATSYDDHYQNGKAHVIEQSDHQYLSRRVDPNRFSNLDPL